MWGNESVDQSVCRRTSKAETQSGAPTSVATIFLMQNLTYLTKSLRRGSDLVGLSRVFFVLDDLPDGQ